MGMYLRAKFEVSSLILTSFRQGGGGGVILPTSPTILKRTPKKPTQIRVKASTETNSYRINLWIYTRILEKDFLVAEPWKDVECNYKFLLQLYLRLW